MGNIDKLERFIGQAVRNVTAEGACTKIQLRQVVDGDANRPINDWAIKDPQDAGSEDAVEILAAEILSYAQEDADAYRSPCRYVAAAWFGDATQPASRSAAFVLESHSMESADAGPSETPDQKGLLALAIKQTSVANAHAESVYRESTRHISQAFEAQGSIIRRLSDALSKREDRETRVMELFEALTTHQHEQKIAELREADNAKRKDQIALALRQIGPVLVNKIVGKDIFPVENPPLMLALEGAFDEIPEEAFAEFLGKLPEHTRIALIEVVQAFARRRADKVAAE